MVERSGVGEGGKNRIAPGDYYYYYGIIVDAKVRYCELCCDERAPGRVRVSVGRYSRHWGRTVTATGTGK